MQPATSGQIVNTGADICKALRATRPGREDFREFENHCREAILFLFRDQFGYWSEQSATDDGLHGRDFIVRLRPKTDFWVGLAHDFRCRYIVFEFKNYAEKISQDQIFSTEKHLYVAALRSIAMIIVRKGADLGALREAGKLILILSLDQLCDMLNAQDKGNDPDVILYALLDELLGTLGR